MTDTTNQPSEQTSASVGLADIGFLLQIVEICTQRGAFRADELSQVGPVYDKVKAFLQANMPKKDEASSTEEGSN